MRDVEAPPLSHSIDHFARQVKERAARFGRRKFEIAGAAVLAVVVMAVGLSVGFGRDRSGVHPSATGTVTTAPAGTPAPDSALGPSNASPARSPAARQQATAGSASSASSAQANRPQAGAPDAIGPVVAVDPPSGGTITVAPGEQVVVSLSPPSKGRWGSLRVPKSRASVVTLVDQTADANGGVHITLKGVAAGSARVQVPCIGNHSASWHSTISVT